MSIKPVLTWPHKDLKRVAREVTDVADPEVVTAAEDLLDTMKAYNALGLAATQIGVDLRMLAYKTSDTDTTMVLVNPTVTKFELPAGADSASMPELLIQSTEGCLSFPGVHATVKRWGAIYVHAQTMEGANLTWLLHGRDAVAIQHEIDHLNGIVMLDHLKPIARRVALKKLKRTKKKLGAYAA